MKSTDALSRFATQAVAMGLLAAKITGEPILAFLRDADALSTAYLDRLADNSDLRNALAHDRERYLLVVAYHAFGAGAYIAASSDGDQDFDDMECAETRQVLSDLLSQGSLELGLKAIAVDPASHNKQVIDNVVMSSLSEICKAFKRELLKKSRAEYEAELLRVYFNAGVTVALSRSG